MFLCLHNHVTPRAQIKANFDSCSDTASAVPNSSLTPSDEDEGGTKDGQSWRKSSLHAVSLLYNLRDLQGCCLPD